MNFPALLLILDGWGIAPPSSGNAISSAKLPTFDRLDKEAMKVTLDAASEPVGLPEGHQGSSEMGHLMIGAGRPVMFPQTQVKTALQNNLIRENAVAQIPSAMQTGAKDGMVTMKQSLEAANKAGLISDDVLERRVGRQRKM